MYSIQGYGDMIADDVRTDAYVRALRQAVRPGSVVLDIGTGTGFFALLACRFGARRVYAVEPGDVIDVARKMAVANGCAESIEFIQTMSTDISLPEPADVIVSDLRGILPFYQKHFAAIADARRRFLAPGGVLIPRADTLWVTCIEAPDLHRAITTPWSDDKYDLDLRAARDIQANQWRRAVVKAEQMISGPVCCASIDYASVVNPNLDTRLTLGAARIGTAHGLCVWFDTMLAEGIHFSNSPEQPSLIYGNAFFPWPEPVALDSGDTIAVHLKGNLIGDDYLWTWETRIHRKRFPGVAAFHFRQSDFFGESMSLDKLRRQSADHVPELNDDGRIDCLILRLMEEKITLGEIARLMASQFPERFPRWQDALTRVGRLSTRYSR